MAQLEHQAVRIENLELMSQYGTNAWKVYNEYVTAAFSHRVTKIKSKECEHAIVFFSCSNLAMMIELAQKELQKFR